MARRAYEPDVIGVSSLESADHFDSDQSVMFMGRYAEAVSEGDPDSVYEHAIDDNSFDSPAVSAGRRAVPGSLVNTALLEDPIQVTAKRGLSSSISNQTDTDIKVDKSKVFDAASGKNSTPDFTQHHSEVSAKTSIDSNRPITGTDLPVHNSQSKSSTDLDQTKDLMISEPTKNENSSIVITPNEEVDESSVTLTASGRSLSWPSEGRLVSPRRKKKKEADVAIGPRTELFDGPEVPPLPEPEPEPPVSEVNVSHETLLRKPTKTRIIVIANQKGGVGKTTTAVNIAAALGLGGLETLLIDMDPQGNASTALGVDHRQGVRGTYEVLLDGDALEWYVVDSQEAPGLKVLPATIDLAAAELELVGVQGRERRLADALDVYLANHHVDYVIFDCPPSLGLLTLNALVAAHEILIPIQCEYYALEGVSQLTRTIDLVKGNLNDDLILSTVLLTMYDGRTRLSAQVADEVRTHFSRETLQTVIPRSVRISEAPSYGQTVITYHRNSAGGQAYMAAAAEIAARAE